MPVTRTDIDRLTGQLLADDAPALTGADRDLLVGALAALAIAQHELAVQARLLLLHGEHRARIESIARDALASVRAHADAPGPLAGFDADAAAAARRDLLAEIESANTARATLAATLGFVARALGLNPR